MDNIKYDENEEIECGDVKISSDVVSAIASVATREIKGIAGVAQNISGGIAELLGKKNQSKGVKVEINNGIATIDAFIIVQYGAIIPDVATQLQEKIKTNVENMTGIMVEKVNIHVQGVNIEAREPVREQTYEEEKPEADVPATD